MEGEEVVTEEKDALLRTKNLVQIAVNSISYMRGMFPEEYFYDQSVPALGMTLKKLMPMNNQSKRLVEWMEKGLYYNALQKKSLEGLFFCICDDKGQIIEEYAFYFSYPAMPNESIAIQMSCHGSSKLGPGLDSNAADVTTNKMRISACKIVRKLVSHMNMSTVDDMPTERTILVKLHYNHDTTVLPSEVGCNAVASNGESIIYSEVFEGCMHDSKAVNEGPLNESMLNTQCCISSRKIDFFLDSGAQYHLCRDRFCLHNFKKLPEKQFVELCSADGDLFTAKYKGDIVYHNIKLQNVLYTPKAGFNVVSVAELDKQGLMTFIGGGRFAVYCVEKSRLIAEGQLNKDNNDYVINTLDWSLPKNQKQSLVEKEEAVEEQDSEHEDWIIDCCCARHMAGDVNMLTDAITDKRSFRTATGSIQTTRTGNVSTHKIFLADVSYCPQVKHNLLSVAQLDKKKFSFTFYKQSCRIQSRETLEDKGYGILNPVTNRYILKEFMETETPAPTPSVKETKRPAATSSGKVVKTPAPMTSAKRRKFH